MDLFQPFFEMLKVAFKLVFGAAIALVLILALVVAVLQGGEEYQSQAVRALDSMGLTNLQVEQVSRFNCGEGDLYQFDFTATNVNDKRVSGHVCCGYRKGCTVRW